MEFPNGVAAVMEISNLQERGARVVWVSVSERGGDTAVRVTGDASEKSGSNGSIVLDAYLLLRRVSIQVELHWIFELG